MSKIKIPWISIEVQPPERNQNVLLKREKPFDKYLLTGFQRDGVFYSNETAGVLEKVIAWVPFLILDPERDKRIQELETDLADSEREAEDYLIKIAELQSQLEEAKLLIERASAIVSKKNGPNLIMMLRISFQNLTPNNHDKRSMA